MNNYIYFFYIMSEVEEYNLCYFDLKFNSQCCVYLMENLCLNCVMCNRNKLYNVIYIIYVQLLRVVVVKVVVCYVLQVENEVIMVYMINKNKRILNGDYFVMF